MTWTNKQFRAAMKAAGWKPMGSPGEVWQHPNAGQIDMGQYHGKHTQRAQQFGRVHFENEIWKRLEMTPPAF